MRSLVHSTFVLAALAAVASCKSEPATPPETQPPVADACAPSHDWPTSGGDLCNRRFAASETKIAKASVAKLATKWVYDAAGDVSATPAVVAGSVYVPDWGGNIERLDAATGKPVWVKSVGEVTGFVDDKGKPLTGLFSRTTPLVTGQNVIFGTQRQSQNIIIDRRPNAFVVAVDKDTGAPRWKTAVHEEHNAAVVTGSFVLDGDHLYVPVSSLEEVFGGTVSGYECCSFRGSVVAMSATTGKILWQTHTISDEAFYKTDPKGNKTLSGFSGASVWSSTPVVDKKRKSLYITTGNNYSAPKGENALKAGNQIDAMIALDLETGAVKWSKTLIGMNDTWTFGNMEGPDFDFGCGANLFTVDGKDVVGAGQKSGIYYALDPDTGNVLWQTQVGPGGHLGGIHWGTATDGKRIYVGVNDEAKKEYTLGGKGPHAGEKTVVGSWAALDPKTGEILWQIANPTGGPWGSGADVNGPVTVANGVVFAGSMDPKGTMFALDAETGNVLWSFESGGTVYGGAAISDGVVYWGAGYVGRLGFGTTIKKLYAFGLP